MKRYCSTDHLLTLGMAFTSDKRAMERRVRGVFARKKSAKSVLVLALALALALAAGAFTTACQPKSETIGPGPTEEPQYLQEEPLAHEVEIKRARVLRVRDAELDVNAVYPAPRVGTYNDTERGSWSVRSHPGAANKKAAEAAFLAYANSIFFTDYTQDDVSAVYYRDETGVRADIWRIDSADGALSGALQADTLQFISAQCKTMPRKTQHESILAAGKSYDTETQESLLDGSEAVRRISSALGVTADETNYNSYQTSYQMDYGWGVCETVQFYLDSGKYCSVLLFGDERLTPYAVAVYPDVDCFLEGVYWHADIQWAKSTVKLKDPVDFRVGEPEKKDMTRERALELYDALLSAAGIDGEAQAPAATFYRDYSGARESYWCLRGSALGLNIAASSGHVFDLVFYDEIGQRLDLPAVAFTDDVMEAYCAQARRMLESVLGEGSVSSASFESVSDDVNGTVVCETPDNARYVVFYCDRAVSGISYYPPLEEGETGSYKNWRADYTYVNVETGEEFLTQN